MSGEREALCSCWPHPQGVWQFRPGYTHGKRCALYAGPRPAAPVVQGADELREAIVEALTDMPIVRDYYTVPVTPRDAHLLADALLSGPLAQLLADAADGREMRAKVERVREALDGIHEEAENEDDYALGMDEAWYRIHNALDGEK